MLANRVSSALLSSPTSGLRFFASPASDSFKNILNAQLAEIKEAGTYKEERVITSSQNANILVSGRSDRVLNFCANNYLGLSDNKKVIQASKDTLDSRGAGLSSVRFICGTQDIHKNLEKQVSAFHDKEDTILYPSCFDANAGLFECVLSNEDAIISDALNHASIIDGVRLSKASRYRYKHMDMEDLKDNLKRATEAGARTKMVVTDGVFSMDGDIAPLDQIVKICEEFNAILMIDECHATGFLGKTGRGTPELFGVTDKVDIINSTFGKALGGASGGYTAASKQVVDMLRQKSRPYLFSNTLAPPVVAASAKALELVDSAPELLKQLKRNTKLFRERMTAAGFTISGNDHPIAPVMVNDARLAADISDAMLQKFGIYVIGFSFPVVPKGLARIRVQLSAVHTEEEVNRCVDAFIEVGKEKGVIQ